MAGLVDLPDVNVWLAFSMADHAHHQRARQYWYEESGDRLVFCRTTALGFLRLSTNSKVMGGRPLTVAEAWNAYGAFRSLPEVSLVEEPQDCERWLGNWARDKRAGSAHWTDAYLAAFARAGGFRLVSFDRDFTRFEGLELLSLQA